MSTRKRAVSRIPSVPATMRAAAIDRFGPPAVLKVHTLPVTSLGPREVLIALHAAGVGVWDASVRDGSWRPFRRPKFPLVPGTDGAGIVAALGARVGNFRVGERAYACDYANPKGGFYAEYIAVKTERAAHVPRRLDLLHAGALPTTGLTALQGVDDALHLKRRETVLIYGASGAVGTLAIQFARRLRARVLATATGRAASNLVQRLGANGVFDPRKMNAGERLRELAPEGIDAALVLAGGKTLEQCLDLVRAGGRIAYPNGVEPEPRRRSRVRVRAYDGIAGPKEFARLERAINEARLQVPIAAVYPLAQAATAHERIERGHVLGRIVLRIRRA